MIFKFLQKFKIILLAEIQKRFIAGKHLVTGKRLILLDIVGWILIIAYRLLQI